MHRGGGGRGQRGRGGGRGRGGYQGGRGPRLPRRKQYFETDATSASHVLLKPVPEELKWKFAQIRPGPGEEAYTRYELKLDEGRGVERSVPRRQANLKDIQTILVQKLSEVFEKKSTFKLDCQARFGGLVWLGDLIECGQHDQRSMVLSQFEGPPKYEDGRIRLNNEYYTRATVRNSIMSEFERRHGRHDPAHSSLQIRIRDVRHDGAECIAVVCKNPATGSFQLERLSNREGILGEYAADMVCFRSFHDLRIATKCFSLEEPEPNRNVTKIIDSIKLSEHGELEMMLKSGPMEVQMIRRREKFVFHVREERDWLIKFTKIAEHPIPRGYNYQSGVVAMVDAGYDNAELDVTLERNLDRGADVREVVAEILRMIEFSLQVVEISEKHLDS